MVYLIQTKCYVLFLIKNAILRRSDNIMKFLWNFITQKKSECKQVNNLKPQIFIYFFFFFLFNLCVYLRVQLTLKFIFY
jgi:hypothetical protein